MACQPDSLIEKSFDKDIDKIKDKKLLKKLRTFIATIENTETIHQIPHITQIQRYWLSFLQSVSRNPDV
jgi:hypothetical protein